VYIAKRRGKAYTEVAEDAEFTEKKRTTQDPGTDSVPGATGAG